MARAYLSKWMSGVEALDYLDFVAEDRRARFKALQEAVRDGAICVRARGRERDRSFYRSNGLSYDPDYAEQVDGRCRTALENADPDLIDLDQFGDAVELRRKDIVSCFGNRRRIDRQAPIKFSASSVKEFVDRYVKGEIAAGRKPTQHGCERAAKQKQFHAPRTTLREEFRKSINGAGGEMRRGRPQKVRK